MADPKRIMLPRTGRHISAWGHGHTCDKNGEQHEGPCICYCGAPQGYNQAGDGDAVSQDREG